MIVTPSLSFTTIPNTEDTNVLKVCHNNGRLEEFFPVQSLITQPHTLTQVRLKSDLLW